MQKPLTTKLILIGLLLLTLWIFMPPFANSWVGDDYVQLGYVREFVQWPFTFPRIFHPTWTSWYYRPAQNVWILFVELIFSKRPFAFYALQLGAHLLTVSLIFRIARQVQVGAFAAFCAAALFALHPHHVDVVTWISAIGIVMAGLFALTAVATWLTYLHKPQPKRLLLTALFCLLALINHEESIILPPFLLLMLLVQRRQVSANPGGKQVKPWFKPNLTRSEWGFAVGFALLILGYLVMQMSRPNATIDLSSTSNQDWLVLLSPITFAEFWLATLKRFTFISTLTSLTGIRMAVVVAGTLLLLAVWFWAARPAGRWGLFWLALHLLFIYLVLWTQKPAFYAGRHIYIGGAGLVIAIGSGIQQVLDWWQANQTNRWQWVPGLLLVVGLTAVTLNHYAITQRLQASWLDNVSEEEAILPTLRQIMPDVQPGTNVYAHRFPITPKFLRSFVYVWYGIMPPHPGGPLDVLLDNGEAAENDYVFDFVDGQVYNLMPELQAHKRTILLLAEEGRLSVLPPDEAPISLSRLPDEPVVHHRRLALPLTPPDAESWMSVQFITAVPRRCTLDVGVWQEAGVRYRIRLTDADGKIFILFDSQTETQTIGEWGDLSIPMEAYWGQPVLLHFEMMSEAGSESTGYVGNPRFSID